MAKLKILATEISEGREAKKRVLLARKQGLKIEDFHAAGEFYKSVILAAAF